MTSTTDPMWHQLITKIIKIREDDHAFRARVSRGLVESTEHYAYPYVLPYAKDSREHRALLRAAAIAASHTKLRAAEKGESQPIGKTLAQMSFIRASEAGVRINADQPFPDPARPDVFSQRIASISQVPLDDAALAIDRLLTIGETLDRRPTVDYYRLTRTLLHWGNGISSESLTMRRSIQRDFYSGTGRHLTSTGTPES